MNKQKQTYLSPETETLVIRFEGVICTSDPLVLSVLGNALQESKVVDGGAGWDTGWEE